MTTRTGQGKYDDEVDGDIFKSTRAWFSTLNSLDSKGSLLPISSSWKITSEERGRSRTAETTSKRESYKTRQKWIQNLINSRHQFTENLFTGIQFLPRVRTPRYFVVFYSPLRVLWSRISSYQNATRNCVFLFQLENGDRMELVSGGISSWWSTSRLFKCVPPLCWSYYIVSWPKF